jgi:outer membrane protein assembly factor BamB
MKTSCLLPLLIFTLLTISSINSRSQEIIIWKFTAKSGIYSSPVIDGNIIYFGSNDSCLYALDKNTGKPIWCYHTKGQIRSKPLIYNETIIFNSTDGFIYSLDKNNGNGKWQFKTEGEKKYDIWDYYLSSPVSSEGLVYAGSGDSYVYAINAENGQLIWKQKTGDIVHASPVVFNQKVMVGSFDGYFYAFNYKTGEVQWKFKTVGDAYFPRGEIQREAVVYENSVVFGSRDYNIYALNCNTGTSLWNMKEPGSWIIATPLVCKGNLYFGTSDSHRFYCMDASTGNVKWSLKLNMRVYGTAAFFEDKVYFGCFNGKLYGVNYPTGIIEYVFQTPESKANYFRIYEENDVFRDDFVLYGTDTEKSEKRILELGSILSTPVINDGNIYFGDSNGFFYAIRL